MTQRIQLAFRTSNSAVESSRRQCLPDFPETSSVIEHDHANVLGVKVSAINLKDAVHLAGEWIASDHPGYLCVTGVHGVMAAQKNTDLRGILNRAVINAPDGMPLSWVGWLQGFTNMDRVFGPEFMLAMCQASLDRGHRHFLYGGLPGVAEKLKQTLEARFPGILIVGTYTPPFRSLTAKEEDDLLSQVHDSKPHILWVGLSTPKQERFMAQYVGRLQAPLLVGVGAAFDFHTGRLRDSSDWIKRAGMQWLHRLLQDPRRLWRRYFYNNPTFVWKVALQILKLRRHP